MAVTLTTRRVGQPGAGHARRDRRARRVVPRGVAGWRARRRIKLYDEQDHWSSNPGSSGPIWQPATANESEHQQVVQLWRCAIICALTIRTISEGVQPGTWIFNVVFVFAYR
jgi:hypothetical protein